MALDVGSRLGHYDVTALIGEGGMGQVYRATDTQLGRDVALKILPDAFAADPDRLARFQREAQLLASLNHPNIGQIHGIEKSEDTQALVLELVEGPTLADRIATGPIPLDEALPIAKQIAEALEAAHEAGVIHRDLKPANIKVREDGTVKVLDFGLAKALDTTPEGDPGQSPTLTAAATQMGVIMGTAAYMSPEQAQGDTVDQRTDVWALGCVLYEVLTGDRAFSGDTFPKVLGAILAREPDTAKIARLDRRVAEVVSRCLQKDAKQRWQEMRHLRTALVGLEERRWLPHALVLRPRMVLALAAVVLVVASLWLVRWLAAGGTAPSRGPLTVVVLPFDNRLQNSELDDLDDGLNAGLITRLSRLRSVRVIGRSETALQQQNVSSNSELARRLSADAVLEGELEWDDGLLVATVRLMDGDSGVVLLSERFEQDLEEVLVLERQIAEELTRFLSLPMFRRECRWLGSDPTTLLEAYRFYSRGMRHLEDWHGPDRQTSVRSAAENLRQAVRLDPTFAAAHVGLARALDARYSLDPDPDYLRDAESALKNAQDIDPELPEAQVAQIRLLQTKGEFTASVDDLERLLRGHPRPDEAYRTIARGYEQAGDLENAKRILEAAVALADDVWDNWNYLGSIQLDGGEFDDARASFARAAQLAPPDVVTPRANLFAVELYEGKFREAVDLVANIEPERMDAGLSSNVATAYFYVEDYDNTESFYRRSIALEPNRPIYHRNLGDLFIRKGELGLARSEFLIARDLVDQFLRESPGNQGRLVQRALYSAKAGDCADALPRSRALQDTWNPTGADAQQLAQALALCDSADEAISLLHHAVALGIAPDVVAVEDEFGSLRDHPDFAALTQPPASQR